MTPYNSQITSKTYFLCIGQMSFDGIISSAREETDHGFVSDTPARPRVGGHRHWPRPAQAPRRRDGRRLAPGMAEPDTAVFSRPGPVRTAARTLLALFRGIREAAAAQPPRRRS